MRSCMPTPDSYSRCDTKSSTKSFALEVREHSSAAERRRIVDVAFVEIDIFLGEISRVEDGAGLAEVQPEVQVEFLLAHPGAKCFEARMSRLAAPEAPANLAAAGRTVTNVDFLFHDPRRAVAERVDDAAPVRVAAVPARFDERAVGHRAGRGVGVREGSRAGDADGDKAGSAFSVADDHSGQFETDMIQGGLEEAEAVRFRIADCGLRISGEAVGQHEDGVVGAHVAVDGDAIEAVGDRFLEGGLER